MEKFTGIPVSFQLVWLLRILLSAFCGGLIGSERATQRKSAGLHTHVVVAIASTLFSIVSKYGFYDMLTFSNVSYDPSRIASLTVTGISFIGAGTILVHKEQISGLTTAAGLWATSAIGIAIGVGLYWVGIVAAVLLLLVQRFLREETVLNLLRKVKISLLIEASNTPHILETIQSELEKNEVHQLSIKIISVSDDHVLFSYDGEIAGRIDENQIIMNLRKYPDIKRITYSPGSK
ncbi:MgtC/SapB family protein [Lactobacillus delbrueckii]|uniref:MgtC/SapB family protein n=1 Tax=Lactobacillus delbrueckii TaxID=1584 RepID=UPI001E2E5D88|nr:MgtC/SapB family protein [Lactobacillus delbrueckii]MCD5566741.1 MgtC/SapB family protein [Lactobacillus delbrueckii subsp. lactis]